MEESSLDLLDLNDDTPLVEYFGISALHNVYLKVLVSPNALPFLFLEFPCH